MEDDKPVDKSVEIRNNPDYVAPKSRRHVGRIDRRIKLISLYVAVKLGQFR